jgi:hypothetical protein
VKINMGTGKYLEALSFNGSLRRRCPTCCAFHLAELFIFANPIPSARANFTQIASYLIFALAGKVIR